MNIKSPRNAIVLTLSAALETWDGRNQAQATPGLA